MQGQVVGVAKETRFDELPQGEHEADDGYAGKSERDPEPSTFANSAVHRASSEVRPQPSRGAAMVRQLSHSGSDSRHIERPGKESQSMKERTTETRFLSAVSDLPVAVIIL